MVELKLSRYNDSNVNVGNVYRRPMPLRNYLSIFSRFIEVGKPGSGHESQCNETSIQLNMLRARSRIE